MAITTPAQRKGRAVAGQWMESTELDDINTSTLKIRQSTVYTCQSSNTLGYTSKAGGRQTQMCFAHVFYSQDL